MHVMFDDGGKHGGMGTLLLSLGGGNVGGGVFAALAITGTSGGCHGRPGTDWALLTKEASGIQLS
jgi:hypothetical protein